MNDKELHKATDDTVIRAMEQDARHVEVRMPEDIDKQKAQEFAEQVREFILLSGIKQTHLAKRIGVSGGQLSQFLKGGYKGNIPNLMRKLANFMDTYQKRTRRARGKRYVETSVAKAVFMVVKQTEAFSDEVEGKIGLIIGDSGHGKSVCLRQYVKANINSVYVELDDTMTSTAIFSKIATSLRLSGFGPLKILTHRLAENLEKREMTIILDEASALDVRRLNQLRQIITVRCKCPLVISGNAHLLKTINDDATKRGYESLDQFRSRLLAVLNLDEMAQPQARSRALYTADDIRKLYEYGGISISRDGIIALQKICRTPLTGRLRTCSIVISAIHLSPKFSAGSCIEAKHITGAIEQLGLPLKNRLPFTLAEITEQEETEAAVKTA